MAGEAGVVAVSMGARNRQCQSANAIFQLEMAYGGEEKRQIKKKNKKNIRNSKKNDKQKKC